MLKYHDLFIDFDDTIYDTHGNANIALRELFQFYSWSQYFSDPNIFYRAYWQTNIELWSQYSLGQITRDFLIVERFRRPLSLGVDGNTNFNPTREYCLDVSDRFLEFCGTKPGTVEGAHDLMQYLKSQGYHLHLASNGFHEVQYNKLRASRMLDYFDTIVLSEDAGANKPSQEFFNYAFSVTGATPETSLMIGDNPNTDIKGAIQAGMDTIYVNRTRSNPDFILPEATWTVNRLEQIKDIL